MKRRLLCLLLMVVMLLPVLLHSVPAVFSAKTTVSRDEATRAIAVVFDNSGSMWANDRNANNFIDEGEMIDSWCRATYALEVFASMMNKGDRLMIYPMNDGITDGENGSRYRYPIEFDDPADASKIRNFYSTNVNYTNFQAVEDAYDGLRKADEDEKHLIILTDGVFQGISSSEIQNKLDKYADKVQVYFLAIGEGAAFVPSENKAGSQFVRSANMPNDPSSRDIVYVLADFCNIIFGRNMLPDSNKANNTITFDVSMKELILFIQGEGISNVKLSGGTLTSQQGVRYSECGGYYCPGAPYDESLQGMIVKYEELEAGSYELSYSGTGTNVNVYYEPDVDLKVLFRNSDGEFDPSTDVPFAGEYTMSCQLVDKNGDPVTSSLLGDPQYEITCIFDGKEAEPVRAAHTTVELKEKETFSAVFKVEFLDGYFITVTSEQLGWGEDGEFEVEARPVSLGVELDIQQDYYVISDIEKGKPIYIKLTRDGFPMTSEDFDAAKVDLRIEGINYKLEAEAANSRYAVYLQGGRIDPGMHDITCKVTGDDGTGKQTTVEAAGRIECQPYAEWIRWVFWIAVILTLTILIYVILHTKLLPKDAQIAPGTIFSVGGRRVEDAYLRFSGKGTKKGSITIESPEYALNSNAYTSFTLDLIAEGYRKEKSAKRKARIVGIKLMDPFATTSVNIDGEQLSIDKDTGAISLSDGEPINIMIQGSVSFTISFKVPSVTNAGKVNCTLTGEFEFL